MRIEERIECLFGISMDEMKSKVRTRISVECRMIYAKMRHEEGASVVQIARELCHNHASVIYYLYKFPDEIKYNKNFAKMYNSMKDKLRVFVSLPINGRKESSKEEKLNKAYEYSEMIRSRLNGEGYEVVTPFDINPIGCGKKESQCIADCIKELIDSDCVYLCSGWRNPKSKGCQLEYEAALIFNVMIIGNEL